MPISIFNNNRYVVFRILIQNVKLINLQTQKKYNNCVNCLLCNYNSDSICFSSSCNGVVDDWLLSTAI